MPSRIIKETIIISESLTAISAEAERFFWRLVVKADDFGLYYGDPRILASLCFPQKPPSEQKIRSWLNELVREDMVGTYTAPEDGKKYLKLLNWGKCQQTRAKSSKYPEPSSFDSKCKQANGNQMLANAPVSGEAIVVPKELQAGYYPTHYHTGMKGGPSTEEKGGGSGEAAFASHSHVLKSNYQTNTDKASEYYYGLAVGDKVILLRNQGGQAFLVLGRV